MSPAFAADPSSCHGAVVIEGSSQIPEGLLPAGGKLERIEYSFSSVGKYRDPCSGITVDSVDVVESSFIDISGLIDRARSDAKESVKEQSSCSHRMTLDSFDTALDKDRESLRINMSIGNAFYQCWTYTWICSKGLKFYECKQRMVNFLFSRQGDAWESLTGTVQGGEDCPLDAKNPPRSMLSWKIDAGTSGTLFTPLGGLVAFLTTGGLVNIIGEKVWSHQLDVAQNRMKDQGERIKDLYLRTLSVDDITKQLGSEDTGQVWEFMKPKFSLAPRQEVVVRRVTRIPPNRVCAAQHALLLRKSMTEDSAHNEVVRPGEGYWQIAERAYGFGQLYHLIEYSNRDTPHQGGLRPGDTVKVQSVGQLIGDPNNEIVIPDDTLSSLAGKATPWRNLYDENPHLGRDPNTIYPWQVLDKKVEQ